VAGHAGVLLGGAWSAETEPDITSNAAEAAVIMNLIIV
jgi:hypothetical protein